MPITIDGSGSIGGLSAGGLPDASVTAADLDGGQTGSAPIYGCRAWVNFDGTRDSTGTASTANTNRFIRASGNVTSVLRNSIGNFTVTFTTAMQDANYSATLYSDGSSASGQMHRIAQTASTIQVGTGNRLYDTLQDGVNNFIVIFR